MSETRAAESPDMVHGRLLESVHFSGYGFERACGELEWLLDEDRWKQVGSGYDDINAFLAAIDFSDFRIAVQQRKKLAKRLAAINANQSTTAKLLGVSDETIARDIGKRQATSVAMAAKIEQKPIEIDHIGNTETTNVAPAAWFQADADPTREAKRITRNANRDVERERLRDDRPAAPLPTGTFRLLYGDPPWRYEHIATESRAIENQYPTMTLDELCAVEIPAADDAVLYLWATSPKLAEAITLIDAWKFSYRTCAVWDKQQIGMGYYFRQQHELLLVAARGTLPVPEPSARPSSVLRAKRGRHSEKPLEMYALLEAMYPTFTKRDRVELFSRDKRPGWTPWTNEPASATRGPA